jgi:hypothetical protein
MGRPLMRPGHEADNSGAPGRPRSWECLGVVRGVRLRLVASAQEAEHWDEPIRQHHYLGVTSTVGEPPFCVAGPGDR